ncbi:4-oxalocrotonate decarboxylase [Undibacterium sp. Jales W-56]|uniref:2-keto-4-pentenoate hydratase n=1 Tax=Undibacterium sp. Jales W-56 TaxID=2897325 RepID=UPI0021D2CCEC|nr:fumarylacetoacetate hydrolase family protein [Undibacterium sp. Jales W-56]MCU6434778.1 4-oxalocrotonate decarboxylase [Undibacterium sp. Jales W-56]
MLMSSQADRYARQFLEARASAQTLAPLSGTHDLSIADAYDIAKSLDNIRIAEGEIPVGRKLGFTNRTLWPKYGEKEAIHAPIWTTLFDSTVRYLNDAHTRQSLTGAVQPRVEPEVVFKLGRTPAADATLDELADCLEWMAHGIEIVVSPYPDWKFEAADAIAALGLHGTLLIGEPRMLSSTTRHHLGTMLANASVSLSCDGSLLGAGFGSNVLDSPLHAIWHLHQLLKTQPQFSPLRAGEIITTGTWTDAYPVSPGQTWFTAFSGVSLSGLSVSFV